MKRPQPKYTPRAWAEMKARNGYALSREDKVFLPWWKPTPVMTPTVSVAVLLPANPDRRVETVVNEGDGVVYVQEKIAP